MNVQFEVTETVRLRRTYEVKITQAEVIEAAGISRREFVEDAEQHVESYIDGMLDELRERMTLIDTRSGEEEQEEIEFDEISDIEGLPCE